MSVRYKYIGPILAFLVIALILFFVQNHFRSEEKQGQQASQEAAETIASQETPPDQTAFYRTYAIREPEKKLEALEKFMVDFPESSNIGYAKREIFKATLKVWPNDRSKMLDAAEGLLVDSDGSEGQASVSYENSQFIAKELLTARLFLDDAEEFAMKSLDVIDKGRFAEDQKKQYAEWEKDIPSDKEMDERYRKELAAYRTTLGRIYLEKGRTADGERILRDAFDVDSTLAQAAIGLAEIAESRGQDDTALDYLTTAALTAGHEMDDARHRVETLFRKTHNGSLDGLETMLDSAYRRLFPNPVEVEPYSTTRARSGRVVLAEFFTGAD